MILEIELKLSIAEADIPAFYQLPQLIKYAVKPAKTAQINSFYYDTIDHLILKNGYVVRVRCLDNLYKQTIKTATPSKEGLHQRFEWEQMVANLTPDLTNFPDQRLSAELGKNQQIIPIFATHIKRTAWVLEVNQTQMEVVLDQGKIVAGDQTEDIHEIELELLTGNKQELLELAKQFACNIHLTPEDQSKAERGYRLHMDSLKGTPHVLSHVENKL
jgi:inorganic triphosphatase YgiF